MEYRVSKEKGSSRYYIHKVNDKTPIKGYGDKKRMYRLAAKMNGIDLKTFQKNNKD